MSIKYIDQVMFNQCITILSHCPKTLAGYYQVPDSVTTIGIEAFAGCKELTKIILPLNLKKIEPLAFDNCQKLTEIILPSSLMSIGFDAFKGCSSLKIIHILKCNPSDMFTDPYLFESFDKTNCILHIPNNTKNIYCKTAPWKSFKNVIETNHVSNLVKMIAKINFALKEINVN